MRVRNRRQEHFGFTLHNPNITVAIVANARNVCCEINCSELVQEGVPTASQVGTVWYSKLVWFPTRPTSTYRGYFILTVLNQTNCRRHI